MGELARDRGRTSTAATRKGSISASAIRTSVAL
jgi:hypothetical protein